MVCRINHRPHFGPVVGYAFKASKEPELVATSLCARTPDEMTREFQSLAARNSRCKNPCVHVVLSPAAGEKLTHQQWGQICEQVAGTLGATQWAAALHNDTHIQHCSLILSRIGPAGKAWSTSNDRYRLREICRAFEETHGLRPTAERSQGVRINKDEFEKAERLQRSGKRATAVPDRLDIAVSVKAAFRQSATLAEFEDRLLRQKITTRWRHDEQGRPVGVSYGRGEASIAGKHAGVSCRMLTVQYSDHGTSTYEQTRRATIPGGTSSVARPAGPTDCRAVTSGLAGQHESAATNPEPVERFGRNPGEFLGSHPAPVRAVGELMCRALTGLQIMTEQLEDDGQRFTTDMQRRARFAQKMTPIKRKSIPT